MDENKIILQIPQISQPDTMLVALTLLLLAQASLVPLSVHMLPVVVRASTRHQIKENAAALLGAANVAPGVAVCRPFPRFKLHCRAYPVSGSMRETEKHIWNNSE